MQPEITEIITQFFLPRKKPFPPCLLGWLWGSNEGSSFVLILVPVCENLMVYASVAPSYFIPIYAKALIDYGPSSLRNRPTLSKWQSQLRKDGWTRVGDRRSCGAEAAAGVVRQLQAPRYNCLPDNSPHPPPRQTSHGHLANQLARTKLHFFLLSPFL